MLGYILSVCVLCTVSGYNIKRPDPICETNDFECFKIITENLFEASLPGIPELGVKSFDPIHHDLIVKNEPGLEFALRDSVATGLKDTILNWVSVTEKNDEKFFHIDITIPLYEMTGYYKLNSTLLNLPLQGNGKYFFNATNIHLLISTLKEYYEKDGDRYVKLSNIQTKTELQGPVHIHADNLFEGNEALATSALKFLNENMKVVAETLEEEIAIANVKVIIDNYNLMLAVIPLKELTVSE